MSGKWEVKSRYMQMWKAAGDSERLRMANLYYEAWDCHEVDPYRSLALYTRGRDEAARLDEPWWVLLYESWRLNALTSFAQDFTAALPVAAQLMVQINAPANRNHEWRTAVLTNVLYTYLSIDPVGYREEIERGFTHLDNEIPQGPDDDRIVLNNRRITYLSATERWDEAFEVAQQSLALAEEVRYKSSRTWHGSWVLYGLCKVCAALGKVDLLAGHATHLVELSSQDLLLRRARAAACCWLAGTERAAGDEQSASRFFHKGAGLLGGLHVSDTICADPLAWYHELGGDLRAAVSVRDRELVDLVRHGMLHRSCQMYIERCRLLAKLESLTRADVAACREAAAKLRCPEWFLYKLDHLVGGREVEGPEPQPG